MGLDEPQYNPELNEGLGGTIELGEKYLFPVELPAGKVREVLEDQAEPDHEVRGAWFPGFTLSLGQGKRYDLVCSRGEDEPVGAAALYDAGRGETLGFYEIDELIERQGGLDDF